MAGRLGSIKILVDSRENLPWEFLPEEKKPGEVQILGSEVGTLDAADYTIIGHEDLIRIERKRNLAELFGNYTPVCNRERFEREMEKLRSIKHKYLLIESTLSTDLFTLSVPQFKFSVPGKRVLSWLDQIEQEYNISVKFVGDCGAKYAKLIFRNITRKYL